MLRYDLTHEYAEKVLKALDEASTAQVARAFKTTLERKLGLKDSPPPRFEVADTSVPIETRFELFFDELFSVAPKDINEPLSLEEFKQRAIEARDTLLEEAEACSKDRKDKELEPMYRDDAANYDTMVTYLNEGNIKDAIRTYWNQDTAARDWMFMGTDEVRNRRTNLLFDMYTRDGDLEE